MIGQEIIKWVYETLYPETIQNNWIITHYEAITGITTVVICSMIVLFAFGIVAAIWRFLGRLARW